MNLSFFYFNPLLQMLHWLGKIDGEYTVGKGIFKGYKVVLCESIMCNRYMIQYHISR